MLPSTRQSKKSWPALERRAERIPSSRAWATRHRALTSGPSATSSATTHRVRCARPRSFCSSATRSRSVGGCSSSGAVPGGSPVTSDARGGDVLGIDISPSMIEYCRRRYPDLDFQVGDLADLGSLPDGSRELVIAEFNVLGVLDDLERKRVLRELHRILAADGLLLFSAHNLAFLPNVPRPAALVTRSRNPAQILWHLGRLPLRVRNHRRLGEARAPRGRLRARQRSGTRLPAPALLHRPRRAGQPARGGGLRAARVPGRRRSHVVPRRERCRVPGAALRGTCLRHALRANAVDRAL